MNESNVKFDTAVNEFKQVQLASRIGPEDMLLDMNDIITMIIGAMTVIVVIVSFCYLVKCFILKAKLRANVKNIEINKSGTLKCPNCSKENHIEFDENAIKIIEKTET